LYDGIPKSKGNRFCGKEYVGENEELVEPLFFKVPEKYHSNDKLCNGAEDIKVFPNYNEFLGI
jgi:hypothetical protein